MNTCNLAGVISETCSSAHKLYSYVISGLTCNYLNKTFLWVHFLSYSTRSFPRSWLYIEKSSSNGFFIIAFLYSDYWFKDSCLSSLLPLSLTSKWLTPTICYLTFPLLHRSARDGTTLTSQFSCVLVPFPSHLAMGYKAHLVDKVINNSCWVYCIWRSFFTPPSAMSVHELTNICCAETMNSSWGNNWITRQKNTNMKYIAINSLLHFQSSQTARKGLLQWCMHLI